MEKKNPADLITGFEEFYAEPPMKPDEAEEEEAMYDTKFSIAAYALYGDELIAAVLRKPSNDTEQHVDSTSIVKEFSLHILHSVEFELYSTTHSRVDLGTQTISRS